MAKFCALFSGSSGNCVYIESGGDAILIDSGASLKAIRQALETIGADLADLSAVFITHEHSDHIKGLPVLAARCAVPVFANVGTTRGILNECAKITRDRLSELETGTSVEIGNMCISSFATSHDSIESVGYTIHTGDGHKLAVATDLGVISDTVMNAISSSEIVMLESNHDVGMLQNGRYPYFLKRRILSDRGHLSNESCSAVLPSLVECGAKHFVLAHLSRDNNMPELAIETANCTLLSAGAKQGVDYTLEAAPRVGPGRLYEL
jgi:phosphoribosyl 1,2-cyclic phosphodiesterase